MTVHLARDDPGRVCVGGAGDSEHAEVIKAIGPFPAAPGSDAPADMLVEVATTPAERAVR
jgi:hypothetical protein